MRFHHPHVDGEVLSFIIGPGFVEIHSKPYSKIMHICDIIQIAEVLDCLGEDLIDE